MTELLSKRMLDALEFAAEAHKEQKRLFHGMPYVSHVFAVALILAKAGCDEDTVMAGALHDVIEDTTYTAEDVKNKFGEHVLKIVLGVTEEKIDDVIEKKKKYLENLSRAPMESKLVSAADMLANRISILRELQQGTNVDEAFDFPMPRRLQFDRDRLEVIKTYGPHPIIEELEAKLKELEKFL